MPAALLLDVENQLTVTTRANLTEPAASTAAPLLVPVLDRSVDGHALPGQAVCIDHPHSPVAGELGVRTLWTLFRFDEDCRAVLHRSHLLRRFLFGWPQLLLDLPLSLPLSRDCRGRRGFLLGHRRAGCHAQDETPDR